MFNYEIKFYLSRESSHCSKEKCYVSRRKFNASDFAENCRSAYMKTVRRNLRGRKKTFIRQTIINKIENKNNEKFILCEVVLAMRQSRRGRRVNEKVSEREGEA